MKPPLKHVSLKNKNNSRLNKIKISQDKIVYKTSTKSSNTQEKGKLETAMFVFDFWAAWPDTYLGIPLNKVGAY